MNGDPQQEQPAEAKGMGLKGGWEAVEYDRAINYVTQIHERFESEPEKYSKFQQVLQGCQHDKGRGVKDVVEEVSTLFADHPDLLKEFLFFLPDGVQADVKAKLEQAVKEAESHKRDAIDAGPNPIRASARKRTKRN